MKTMNAAMENVKLPNQLEEIKERLKKELTQMIDGKDSAADSEALLSRDDTKQLISFTIENLCNHVVKLVGKNEYTYSPYLMGLAMNQFIRGRSVYEDL